MRHKHNPSKCEVCNGPTFWVCGLCDGKPMCISKQTGLKNEVSCVLDYHDEHYFGLYCSDFHYKKTLPSRWVPANDETKQQNRNNIECLRELLKERENVEEDVMESQGGAQEGEEGGEEGGSVGRSSV